MPNWVNCRITFEGNQNAITSLFSKIKNPDNDHPVIDFEKIIPMPEDIYRGNLGQKERELYGKKNWYDWSLSNWGTKWNATEERVDCNRIYFATAWSVPHGILDKLAEMCHEDGISFYGEFCDEDWSSNSGEFETFEGGLSLEYDQTSEQARQRCIDLWGWDPEEEDEGGEIF